MREQAIILDRASLEGGRAGDIEKLVGCAVLDGGHAAGRYWRGEPSLYPRNTLPPPPWSYG